METITLPRKSGKYKFILIDLNGTLYLRFGPPSGYHSDILEKFLAEAVENNIVFRRESILVKGGFCEIDHSRKTMKFHGESKAYGPADNAILADVLRGCDYECELSG